jgi:hypothetical protein
MFAIAGQSGKIPVQTQAMEEHPVEGPTVTTALDKAVQTRDLDSLLKTVRNGSPNEQALAFDALNAMDPELAKQSVISNFRNHELGSRLQFLELIDRSLVIDPQTVNSLLRDALDDGDPLIRDYALRALTIRAREQPELLSSSDVPEGHGEAQQLARIHFAALRADTFTLLSFLRNGDAVVQSAALDRLAEYDSTSAIRELTNQFADQTSTNRLQTLDLLIRSPIADQSSVFRVLEQAAHDPDPIIAAHARPVLNKRNTEAATPNAPNVEP